MIVAHHYGYLLQCTGCKATLGLTLHELSDPYRAAEIRSAMRTTHRACDGYHDVQQAKNAIKAQRRAARQAVRGGSTP